MRKVSILAANALMNKKPFKRGNTQVSVMAGVSDLFLYGNWIATFRGNKIEITTSGWNTRTTLDRLNALPGVYASIKKGVLYLNGEVWDGRWIEI